jgi:predicted metal-dependent phosphoesterase TrpH
MSSVLFQNISAKTIQKYNQQGYTGADLHFHTEFSMDAISKIENVLHLAKKKRIGFAVSDHNQIGGAIKALKLKKQKKQDTLVIPAVEATCKEGAHLIYYFYDGAELQEWYKKELEPHMKHNPFFAAVPTVELIDNSTKYNAVLCTPHPFAPGVTGFCKQKHEKKTLKKIDVVEVMNAFNIHNLNKKAVDWAKQLHKGFTAGSDGHTTPELGTALTFVQGNTVEEFLTSLKKGESVAIGNEESLFHKAVISLLKEETYLKKAKEHHEAFRLIESQYGTEATYLKKKEDHERSALLHYFRVHHW